MQLVYPQQLDNNIKEKNLHGTNLAIVLLLVCFAWTRTPDLRRLTAVTNWEEIIPVRKQQRLADGCYNVFVDVGANIGVHTRFLYESLRYIPNQVRRSFSMPILAMRGTIATFVPLPLNPILGIKNVIWNLRLLTMTWVGSTTPSLPALPIAQARE